MRSALLLHFIFLSIFLTACSNEPASYENYFAQKHITLPSESRLQQCRGYDCRFRDTITLNDEDWKAIRAHFKPKAKTAEMERQYISAVIGTFEKRVGDKSGTKYDLAGTFQSTGNFQQDCVDESTNTTTYLIVLQEAGLISFHKILQPNSRLLSGWPHQTAVIMETESGEKYAVDSWFHDNGVAAEIVPVELWEDGWSPAKPG